MAGPQFCYQLCKVQEQAYDIIFMDMYMASVSKQLTGTETTRELRSRGCKSLICKFFATRRESGAKASSLVLFAHFFILSSQCRRWTECE
jgi:CheY-like chemotaxis protein